HVGARLIDRTSRSPDPLDCKPQVIERCRVIASAILDRESCNAGRHTPSDTVSYFLGLTAIARREVGTDRYIDSGDDIRNVRQAAITGDGAVGIRQPLRERKTGAGCCKRWESEVL